MQTPGNIIITGASSGIGAALATDFARPGITLGLIGRDAARLGATENRCRERGAEVATGLIDVTDSNAMSVWLLEFDTKHPVDLVIANSGITDSLPTTALHEPADVVHHIVDVNFKGVVNTVLPLVARMRERGQGHIAIMSSITALRGIPVIPAYSASKAALKSYFEALRVRLAPHGIAVSIICPGYIQTPMTDGIRGFKYPILPLDNAVRRIRHGLARRRPLMVFPWSLRLLLGCVNLMPETLADRALRLMFPVRTGRPRAPG